MFQLNRDRSSWVEPVQSYDKCVLLKDHNAVTRVRLEPEAPPSRVKHSTTEPLRSLNVGRVHYEEQVCEIILNLGQWFRRCRLKDFLSVALAVLLFGAAEPFMKFGRGYHRE